MSIIKTNRSLAITAVYTEKTASVRSCAIVLSRGTYSGTSLKHPA